MNRLIAVALLTLLAFTARSSAALRPHFSAGTGQFISPTQYVGAGHATHLGNYLEAGTVAFSATSNPAILNVDGSITYTASDGSELWAHVSGQLNAATGAVTGTITYTGGTGRFDDATGSSSIAAQVGPDGSISATVNGTIDY